MGDVHVAAPVKLSRLQELCREFGLDPDRVVSVELTADQITVSSIDRASGERLVQSLPVSRD